MKSVLPLLSLLGLVLLGACTQKEHSPVVEEKNQPNIILMIGDGMGVAQMSAAYYYNEAGKSVFEQFPYSALVNTSSLTHRVTDSGAGATAFATGKRTQNKRISSDTSGVAMPILTEILARRGYRNGVVATSSITHATPAAFYAQQASRYQEEEIAAQLPASYIDIAIAGGYGFFNKREDKVDYLDSLTYHHFEVDTQRIWTAGQMQADKRYAFLLNKGEMPPAHKGREDFLPKATQTAAAFLSKGDAPFFLMVEGSQIDWACHANDAEYVIAEVLDFEKAVAEALRFAKEDGNTILIVTADHETGGFALAADPEEGYNLIKPSFASGEHSASLVPLLMYGPVGVDPLDGIIRNTDIFDYILQKSK